MQHGKRRIAVVIALIGATGCEAQYYGVTTEMLVRDPTKVEVYDPDRSAVVLPAGSHDDQKSVSFDCGSFGNQDMTVSRANGTIQSSRWDNALLDQTGASAKLHGVTLEKVHDAGAPNGTVALPFRTLLAGESYNTGPDTTLTRWCSPELQLRTPQDNVVKLRQVEALDWGPAGMAALGAAGFGAVAAMPFFLFPDLVAAPPQTAFTDPGGDGFMWLVTDISIASGLVLVGIGGSYLLLNSDRVTEEPPAS